MDSEASGPILTDDSQWKRQECAVVSQNIGPNTGDHLLCVIGENEVACTGKIADDNTIWTYYYGRVGEKKLCILECNGMVLNIDGDQVGCRKRVKDYNNLSDGEPDVVFEYKPVGSLCELKLNRNPGLYLGFGTNGMPLKPSKVESSTEQALFGVYPTYRNNSKGNP